MLQPPGPPSKGVIARVRARQPSLGAVLGAVLRAGQVAPSRLDLVVVDAATPLVQAHASGAAVLVRVDDVAQIAAALAGGAAGVVAAAEDVATAEAIVEAVRARGDALVLLVGSAELETIAGVDGVFGGRVCVVTSPGAARAAFARGADLVLYDVPAMLDELMTTLPLERPYAAGMDAREPIVLLSGMLGDAALWDGVAQRLADVLMPVPTRIDLDDSVVEMAATVLAAAPRRFALAGHSLGGIVALEIMRQAPERVTRLVLVNAGARGPVEAQQQAWAAWRDRTVDGRFADVAAELAHATLAPGRRNDAALVAANEAMAAAVGADGFLRQLAAQSSRPDSLESLAAIDVPVLVLSGGADDVCPPALQRELVERCARAQLVTIEDGGHMLPLECADEVAAHLRSWLGDQGREVAAS